MRGVVEGDHSSKGRHSEAWRQDSFVHSAFPYVQQIPEVARGALMILPVCRCEEGGYRMAA